MSQSSTPRPAQGLALSPSRAGDYQQCPLLYRFRAIDKLPESTTIAQVKGTLVHAVLEDLHALPAAQRTYPVAVKMLKPRWAGLCEKDPDLLELVPEDEEHLLPFLVECRELLKGYFMMENPAGFDAAEREKFVSAVLPNGVPIRGFIDRVDIAPTGEVRVVDYKTGKKPKPQWDGQARFQMKFYALAWWRLTGTLPTQLRLMYLKVADDLAFSPTARELELFEQELRDLWDEILADVNSGDFRPKTSRLCDWCHHQDKCPAFGGTPPEYPLLPLTPVASDTPTTPGGEETGAHSPAGSSS